jgi:hypothetical protein
MLGGTRVVSQRLRGCNDDLIGIGPERRDRLGDELVERHCLLGLLTVRPESARRTSVASYNRNTARALPAACFYQWPLIGPQV